MKTTIATTARIYTTDEGGAERFTYAEMIAANDGDADTADALDALSVGERADFGGAAVTRVL